MAGWLKKFKEIAEGWINDIHANPEIIEMGKRRAEICASCPLNIEGYCSKYKKTEVAETFIYDGEKRTKGQLVSGCGCPLKKKVLSTTTQCPTNKWLEE